LTDSVGDVTMNAVSFRWYGVYRILTKDDIVINAVIHDNKLIPAEYYTQYRPKDVKDDTSCQDQPKPITIRWKPAAAGVELPTTILPDYQLPDTGLGTSVSQTLVPIPGTNFPSFNLKGDLRVIYKLGVNPPPAYRYLIVKENFGAVTTNITYNSFNQEAQFAYRAIEGINRETVTEPETLMINAGILNMIRIGEEANFTTQTDNSIMDTHSGNEIFSQFHNKFNTNVARYVELYYEIPVWYTCGQNRLKDANHPNDASYNYTVRYFRKAGVNYSYGLQKMH